MPIDTEKVSKSISRKVAKPFGEDLVSKEMKEELLKAFDSLKDDQKQMAIDLIKQLALPQSKTSPDRPWMKLVGILDSKSAEQMRPAIEEDCETIDETAW